MLLPDSDEDGDEHGADGVSDHQVVFLHQQSRDDHTDTAQSVSDDVQEDACNATQHTHTRDSEEQAGLNL